MSITAYTGLPGSGKSYGVFLHVIIPALEKGRDVWTNIPVNEEELSKKGLPIPTHFETRDILDNDSWFQTVLPKGALIVIDECWRLWAAGLKANNAVEGHKSFLAEHRHMVGECGNSVEVVLVTQDLAQIASFSRNLVETTYRAEKLTRVGAKNSYRIDVYHGAVTGPKPPKSRRDREIFGKYKPEIFKLYQSHTMSATGLVGDESKSDNRSNILGGNIFKVYGAVILAGIFIVWWGFGVVVEGYSGEDESVPVVSNPDFVRQSMPGDGRRLEPIKPIPKPKPQKYDFLNGLKVTISANIGLFPDIDFVFTASSGNTSFRLTQSEMTNMGYKFIAVNECLVFIMINQARHVAACSSKSDSKSLLNFDMGQKES
jgi:zona occludens toxin